MPVPLYEKIEKIAKEVYGADGVDYTKAAKKAIDGFIALGADKLPVCMAKTQYSLSDDPTKLGRPSGFRISSHFLCQLQTAGAALRKALGHGKIRACRLANLLYIVDLRLGVRIEVVDGHDHRHTEFLQILNMRQQIDRTGAQRI